MGDARHWADEVAAEVLARGIRPVISTGISPSGEIHVGNLREILTGDAIYRALSERGAPVRFHFVADDLDPLRRVYPFLDPQRYAGQVGRPLCTIPCPCSRHASYADHFLEPFLQALERLRVDVEVIRAADLYRSGRMDAAIGTALAARETIAAILRELTGKPVQPDWSPLQVCCTSCGRLDRTRVVAWSAEQGTVAYRCACGGEGSLDFAHAGKLTWRVDWPARWWALGVTVEPFGKDHATRGGSYDTGARIAREVYRFEPPYPVPYEWIGLRGQGDMASSKGNVLSAHQALEIAPPEVLRYLVLRERPQRAITFDPGLGLLRLVDEVDDAAARGRDERALQLSRAGGFRPVGVPFKHLVVVAQAADFQLDRVMEILERTGYPGVDREAVEARLGYARRWLERYAPEELRFTVQASVPREAVASLSRAQRDFLERLASRLESERPPDGERIHALVYETAKQVPDLQPAEGFQAIYLALLGKTRGPRAGWFLAVLGTEACAQRFRQAARAAG